jgi:hypothetical protein
MTKRRKAVNVSVILTAIAALVPTGIMLDKYLIERRQMVKQQNYEAQVKVCETSGGRWFAGECQGPTD